MLGLSEQKSVIHVGARFSSPKLFQPILDMSENENIDEPSEETLRLRALKVSDSF
jgi:hypothetical protein